MPKNEAIAIFVGTFDGSDNTFTWKKTQTFSTIKAGYASFKELCKKCVAYTYDDLMEVYNSPRLDIELRRGKELIKWFGVYEKDIKDAPEDLAKAEAAEGAGE